MFTDCSIKSKSPILYCLKVFNSVFLVNLNNDGKCITKCFTKLDDQVIVKHKCNIGNGGHNYINTACGIASKR